MIWRVLFAVLLTAGVFCLAQSRAQVPMTGAGLGKPFVAAGGSTWNPGDKTANMSLTGGNLTAASSNASPAGARATCSHTTGLYYWEVTINVDGGGFDIAITALTATSSLTSADANNVQIFNGNGQIWTAGSLALSFGSAITAVGNVIQVAMNVTSRDVWFRGSLMTLWNNSGIADPTMPGTGQILPATVAIFPGIEVNAMGLAQGTANFGPTFVNMVPTGYGNC
jgi:hypothetical protein